MRKHFFSILVVVSLGCSSCAISTPADVELTVHTDQPVHPISPMLYGLFFEDINFAADGGLYAEQVRNRSFEFEDGLFGWSKVQQKAGDVDIQVLADDPLNSNNPHYLRLTLRGDDDNSGIENSGYGGIVLQKGKRYFFSVHARSAKGFQGGLIVRLQSSNGTVVGRSRIGSVTGQWKKYSAVLEAKSNAQDAKLVLLAKGKGAVDLDMVSLFPKETWKNQPNGLRADLVQMLADIKPSFIRFPGGCIVEGKDLANAYRWKDTIGDPAERKLNWNRWAGWNKPPEYYQSYGLGFFEFFRLCDDLNAEPLPILNCGMSCQYQDAQLVPLDELGPYVQDALDLIEYANGPVDSPWGAKRAASGHPEPFGLKYLGVGNEQWDNQYFKRYDIFYKAIKAKYPEMQIITTSGPGADGKWFDLAWNKFKTGTPAEIVDEHYYKPPQWFLRNTRRYDDYDRKGPKVFAGEYAAHQPNRKNDLFAALSEAAFITGLERNSDVVVMSSYAPLLARTDSVQWAPDLIWFDKTDVYGTPSYYVQKLFSNYRGTKYLKNELNDRQSQSGKQSGRIGLCTWQTTAEFKDVKVTGTSSNDTLFSSLRSEDWEITRGKWEFGNGACVQLDEQMSGAICYAGDLGWSDYTLSLKARKTDGKEGFIIIVRGDQLGNGIQWNLGGWGNTKHAIQRLDGGASVVTDVSGWIEKDRWYDIQIVLKGENVQCFLDGQMIHTLDVPAISMDRVFTSCSLDEQTKTVYIKAVNPTPDTVSFQVHLKGRGKFKTQASAIILTGNAKNAENTLRQPQNVYPQDIVLDDIGKDFTHMLRPYSVTLFKVKQK